MGHKKTIYLNELARLKNDNDVLGVLLVGKGAKASDETFEALNDIDLIVLTRSGDKNRRSVKVIDGVDIDMSYLPVSFVDKCLEEINLLWIEILASGKIVYSKNIEGLIGKSKRIWEKGSEALSPLKKAYYSFYLTTSLEDIENRLNKEALAKYLINEWLSSAMAIIFRLNRVFLPLKKKRWIDKIKTIDPLIGELIEEVLITSDLGKQFEGLVLLHEKITADLGGVVSTWSHEEFPED